MAKTEEGHTYKSEVEELLLSDEIAGWQLGLFILGGILTVLMAVWSS